MSGVHELTREQARRIAVRAVVEGTRGTWRVDPAYLGQPFAGRAALLSPFDRLVHDRKRTLDIFEFEYQLEMYKPVTQRRWGYYALPILYGDRLVGSSTPPRTARPVCCGSTPSTRMCGSRSRWPPPSRRRIRDLARWLRLDLLMPQSALR